MASSTLSLDNPVFRTFMGYAALVILKTCLMSVMTAFRRMTKKAFVNPEDSASFSKKGAPLKVNPNDSDVERVRRAHLNDLENVLPFVLTGLLYVVSGPTLFAAQLHFRIFTVARYLHSVVYLLAIPQPSRALCFMVGFVTTLSMLYHVLSQAAF